MIKDILFTLLREGNPWLGLIIGAQFLCWSLAVYASLSLHGIEPVPKPHYIWAVFGTIFSFAAQLFFPFIPASIGAVFILAIMLITSGVGAASSFLTAFFVAFSTFVFSVGAFCTFPAFEGVTFALVGITAEAMGPLFIIFLVKFLHRR